ncbi:MAG: hypothetical protein K8R64_04195 [Methanosarcinaceae archaeon]|nr:hypothetical protein [Methanosarcinaceae archaeon]
MHTLQSVTNLEAIGKEIDLPIRRSQHSIKKAHERMKRKKRDEPVS